MNAATRVALGVACCIGACARPVELVQAPMGTASALPSAIPTPAARAPAVSLLGSWTGVGVQSDGHRWPVRVTLTSDTGACGTIVYSTVPCRGTWTCSDTVQKDGWREAVESIDSGQCIDGGTFRYRLQGASIEWTWSKADGQNLTARGTLTRNDADPDTEDTKSVDWDSDEE